MMLTTKGRYAVVAMVDLAIHGGSLPTTVENISARQHITSPYLEQIFSKLRKQNLVTSVKGPGGGYMLAREAREITVADVVGSVSESIEMTKCRNDPAALCVKNGTKCLAHDLWDGLTQSIFGYLNSITIADMARRHAVGKDIYLDHNSTSPIKPVVSAAMADIYRDPMNPSSVHKFGQRARTYLESARRKILHGLGASKGYKLIFTSSGSEANNLVMNSFVDRKVICSEIEHLSVINALEDRVEKTLLKAGRDGVVQPAELENILKKSPNPVLVSIMMANNETGVIQDIAKLSEICHRYGALMHSDIIQAVGRVEVDISELGVDLATVSSHKVGGPLGAACLIMRNNLDVNPIIKGGGQEKGQRAGTENVAACHGFAVAIDGLKDDCARMSAVEHLRNYLEELIMPEAVIVGRESPRIPNTSCIIMNGVGNETQIIHFDLANIAVSAGSACSSGKIAPSHVLKACGYSEQDAASAVRVSLGVNTTKDQVEHFAQEWKKLYKKLGGNYDS